MTDIHELRRYMIIAMGYEKRRKMTMTALKANLDELVAEMIAYRLVENTNTFRKRQFFVFSDKPVPFRIDRKYKKKLGVSFKQAESEAAKEWVKDALLARFTVFYSSSRTWGCGRSLEDGIYGEDGWRLSQALEARGIPWNER